MENFISMNEVFSSKEIQGLVGCRITSVQGHGTEGEGICMDCEDDAGNQVIFLISEDGSFHFHNGKKKNITVEQLGELAILTGCSDIESVHFNSADPLVEIIIKPIGSNATDRVLTLLRGTFPMLEVTEDKWDFEGELHPTYQCSDPDYNFTFTVAVMPESAFIFGQKEKPALS